MKKRGNGSTDHTVTRANNMTAPTIQIQNHNAPLKAQMKEKGAKLVQKNNHVFFQDGSGEYVPYPVGYITGPSPCDGGFYLSVQGRGGWSQREWAHGEIHKASQWALERAESNLKEASK
jgi:hypothetical protein